MTVAPDVLYDEMAFVAYHFGWSFDALLDLEHPVRRTFVERIARLNRRAADQWSR